MSGVEPTQIDANGIQVVTADQNATISIGPTGLKIVQGLVTPPLIEGTLGYSGFSTTNPLGIEFQSKLNMNNNDIINVGTITAANIIGPVNTNFFYDEQWGEGATVNGLLGMRLDGSGAGTTTMAAAEADHYGIVRVQTPSSNTNTTWTTRSPLIWSNMDYVEIVFRPWPIGTSTNTTCSIGLMNSVTSLETTAICLMYSTNVAPANTWQLRVNSASAHTFNVVNFPHLVNTWLKIRLTNTNNTGSWSATFTRLDTNVSETATGTGVVIGTEFYVGGGVSCTSGASSKRVDFDSIELQLQ